VEPEVTSVAVMGELAGAQLILAGWCVPGGLLTDRDLWMIREVVHTDLIILAPLDDAIVERVIKISPQGVILVDGRWDGKSTVLPLNMGYEGELLTEVCGRYKSAGVPVALFLEPDSSQMKSAARTGASGVVLDCLEYSVARTDDEITRAYEKITDSAFAANKFRLITSVGHGLNYANISSIAAIPHLEDVYIGSAIATRALFHGLDRAITDMQMILYRGRNGK